MPDRRRHRGAHPRDAEGFTDRWLDLLRQATADLSWLRGREYPDKASLALVGDRYRLTARQRSAVSRCAVGEQVARDRQARQVSSAKIRRQVLLIDGYNVLLTVEMALGGGVVLLGRDGTLRDMAAMSRHFRQVEQTRPALECLGRYLQRIECREARWYFDRPVSNSGRLRTQMLALAAEHDWPWQVALVPDPDKVLAIAEHIVATADGGILDQGPAWYNLARRVVEDEVEQPWVVDLRGESAN